MESKEERSCNVVEFGSSDYEACLDLRNRILREPLGLEFTEEEAAQEPDAIHVACLQDGDLLGTAQLQQQGSWLKMRQVAVEASAQGSGVGGDLLEFCEQLARNRGYAGIYCHARQTAIAFYAKNDYLAEGEVFIEVGIRHQIMRKSFEQ